MKFSTGFRAAALCTLLCAVPASAQDGEQPQEPIPDFDQMSAQELATTLRDSGDRWIYEACAFGQPLYDALAAKRRGDPDIERARQFAVLLCADEKGDYAAGAETIAQLEKTTPGIDLLDLGLYFDSRLEDADAALARLGSVDLERAESLNTTRFSAVARVIQKAGKAEALSDLTLEWYQNRFFGGLSRDMQSIAAFRALDSAARQNDPATARRLLDFITSPASYITLLTSRKYEVLWPEIEQRAGEHLAAVGAENVQVTQARLANAPEDRDRFSDAAHALHFNGQFQEAIDLAAQWQQRESNGKAIEEGDGWALNIQAYAYDSLGQAQKADAIFDQLAALDPDENPWVVNFVINRSSRLVGHGRWEEGLEAAQLARTVAEDYGSVYAKMIIASNFACALHKLDRDEEAAPELEFLRANASDGLALALKGLLCHGLNEEATDVLIAAFNDPAQRDAAIAAFEVGPLDLFYTQSILPNPTALLADSPELQAELAKSVRPMPAQFIPQASLKRATLDLPDWE